VGFAGSPPQLPQSSAGPDRSRTCSRGAECDADALADPAGGVQLVGEGAVEGVQGGLAVAVVGERAGLVVQQHAHALVARVAGHRLPPAAVPGAELLLVQLQAPRQLIHAHHAALAALLAGDVLVGYLRVGKEKEKKKTKRLTMSII